MNDSEFIAALQALFDANDPADSIDRHNGFGRDHRIVALRIVPSDDGFDDLEVTIEETAGRRRRVISRVLFDHDWREISGLLDLRACAAYVVARSESQFGGDDHVAGAAVELTDALTRHGTVSSAGEGVFEVVEEGGGTLFVHVKPMEWADYVKASSYALDDLDETIGSRWDDEDHIVFFRGEFHQSIRADLPPVRSMLLREPTPMAGEWQAFPPEAD